MHRQVMQSQQRMQQLVERASLPPLEERQQARHPKEETPFGVDLSGVLGANTLYAAYRLCAQDWGWMITAIRSGVPSPHSGSTPLQ
jgi:hypothetical protein